MWRPQHVDDGGRRDVTLGEQHEQRGRGGPRLAGERGAALGRRRRPRRPWRREHLGRLLGDLARRPRRRRRRAADGVRALGPGAGALARSSPTASRASAKPCASLRVRRAEPLRRRSSDRGAAVAGRVRPGRPVTSTASPSQSLGEATTAARCRSSRPCATARPRDREWKWTSPVARVAVERLGVHPADHQDPPVGRVLDDAATRPSGPSRARVAGSSVDATRSSRRRPGQADRDAGAASPP